MKKHLTILLALLMALSLIGCGSSADSSDGNVSTDSVEETDENDLENMEPVTDPEAYIGWYLSNDGSLLVLGSESECCCYNYRHLDMRVSGTWNYDEENSVISLDMKRDDNSSIILQTSAAAGNPYNLVFENGENWSEETYTLKEEKNWIPEGIDSARDFLISAGFQYGEDLLEQEKEFEAEHAGAEFEYYSLYYANYDDWQDVYDYYGNFYLLVMCDAAAFFVCRNYVLPVEYNSDHTAIIYDGTVFELEDSTKFEDCIEISDLGLVLSHVDGRDSLEYYLTLSWLQ